MNSPHGPVRKVSVCVVEIGKGPRIVDIPATLEAQEELVGGPIQVLRIPNGDRLFLAFRSEGRKLVAPVNRTIAPWGDLRGVIYFARWDSEGEIQSLRLSDINAIVDCLDSGSAVLF